MVKYPVKGVALHLGDCREVLAAMRPASIDAIVTDPPYGLNFMGKDWDKPRPGEDFVEYFHGGDFQRWTFLWARQALRALKPGGHMLVMAGTRLWHRTACGVEDAGFEIRDTLMWLYGTGFPKSLDVSKAIDKADETRKPEREAVGRWLREQREAAGLTQKFVAAYWPSATGRLTGCVANWELGFNCPTWEQWVQLRRIIGFGGEMDAEVWRLNGRKGEPSAVWESAEVVGKYQGVTPGLPGKRFSVRDNLIRAPATPDAHQWEGWGTALKPAWEPIILCRKPLEGTVAANVQEHGVGGLSIDACRIATDENTSRPPSPNPIDVYAYGGQKLHLGGRGHSKGRWPANVVLDEDAAALLDAQSGGASRFFYCAKASRKERGEGNDHPTVKPITLMRWLCRLVTPPKGVILDPFIGSGTMALAALAEGFRCVGIDTDEHYLEIAQERISHG